ncbi:MAG: hybrid sensor histidine kinase/response regulator [Myxococcota bacterium]
MPHRLDRRDGWLLAVTIPLFVLSIGLHARENLRTGLAQLPVFAEWRPGDHPRVGGFRLETDSSGSGLALGDRLIRIAEHDLRGVGYIGFQAIGLAHTTPGHPTELEIERDGVRRVLPLESRPHPAPWSRVPTLLLTAGVALLLLLRAPNRADARRFYVCFMTYAIAQAHFYGGPEWQTWAAQIAWSIGSVLMIFFLMEWVRNFPPELPSPQRLGPGVSFAAAGLYAVFVRANYLLAWPLPIAWVPPVSFASHGLATVLALGILTWNYRRAPDVGRRRLRWILLGTSIGSLPVIFASLAPTLLPDWQGFRAAFAIGFVSSLIWMVGALLAVIRDKAFDIDRLIGTTAAVTVAIGVGGAGLVVGAPMLSDFLAETYGIEATTTRLGLGVFVGAAIIVATHRLRPRIDRLLFPEQIQQRAALQRLAAALRDAHGLDALLDATTAGTADLLDAEAGVRYAQVEGGFVRRTARAVAWPAVLEGELPAASTVDRRGIPAAVRELAAIVCPVSPGGPSSMAALLCFGARRSGEPYTDRDLQLLDEIATICEREWLRILRYAAEAEVAARTNRLAEASHDLRQPLHAVALLAETLRGRLSDPEVRSLVERIGDSTHELDEMLSLLLDRSSLDAGGIEPKIEPVRWERLRETLERDFEGPAAESGTRLRFVRSSVVLRTDRLLMLRILRNLVSNALRHAQGASIVVGVRRVEMGRRARIEVRDDGPGIAEADQDAVFRSFVQLPGSRRRGRGLGLGLSIVDDLARLLGAEVTLRSKEGVGSCFAIEVDRTTAPAEHGTPVDALGQTLADSPRVTPVDESAATRSRVLVLDDDEAVRASTADLVGGWGRDVRVADTLDAALALVGDGWWPLVVLSDHHLESGITGLEAVAVLRRKAAEAGAPRPFAVYLMAEKSAAELAIVEGTGDHALRKPVRPARLRSLLERLDHEAAAPRPLRTDGTGRAATDGNGDERP